MKKKKDKEIDIEKLLHIKLTPLQKKYHDAFRWLVKLDISPEGVGKSFLLAVCFIEEALENRNTWVSPFDNVPRNNCLQDRQMKHIYELITYNSKLKKLVVMRKNSFKFIEGDF
ncbi:MAG: hypothetical protein WC957_06375 [Candidatus Neomarinimicrobiota bacterium]|jgi:hypothetical protein